MQYILFAEAVIGAGIGLTIIQTVVYARVEILCESSHYTHRVQERFIESGLANNVYLCNPLSPFPQQHYHGGDLLLLALISIFCIKGQSREITWSLVAQFNPHGT